MRVDNVTRTRYQDYLVNRKVIIGCKLIMMPYQFNEGRQMALGIELEDGTLVVAGARTIPELRSLLDEAERQGIH